MPQFVETMWHLAMTRKYRETPLSKDDCKVFADAIEVRNELDHYHARANLDDRNIEDVLSILSFNVLSGSEKAKEQLAVINKAIARTIELTCEVRHPGLPERNSRWTIVEEGAVYYRQFWNFLLRWHYDGNELPTIITFNYDLVLERALLQCLISKQFNLRDPRRAITHLGVNYQYPHLRREIWQVEETSYGPMYGQTRGTAAFKTGGDASDALLEIEILKLHGSVNFPRAPLPKEAAYNIAAALDDPFILPPIFNKISSDLFAGMWRTALQRMNEAQNVIIVGYSLPQTDIYMQYFLRAGVGPNLNLNDIFIFNPTLYRGTSEAQLMEARYAACFSEQLRRRLQCRPQVEGVNPGNELLGTMRHFVAVLGQRPRAILY